MTTHPILFSAPMIQALRAGRKTMTRRIVKPRPIQRDQEFWWIPERDGSLRGFDIMDMKDILLHLCPYGRGDLLYVREQFSGLHEYDVEKWPPSAWFPTDPLWYWADGNPEHGDWTRPKPGIHMPRWVSRLTLRLTDVKVERLHEISAADILAEGAVDRPYNDPYLGKCPLSVFDGKVYVDLMSLWARGWDSINAKKPGCAWRDNPFVWRLGFEVIRANIDDVLKSEAA